MPSRGEFESSKSKKFSTVNRNKAKSSEKLSCYCCGKAGHDAKKLLFERKNCGQKSHLDVACRSQYSEKYPSISTMRRAYIQLT